MTTQVFVGDVGTEIALDCGTALSSATVRRIIAKKPNGTSVTWTAVADGTNGIKYVTQPNDLDIAGVWQLQAYVELPAWKGSGAVALMTVAPVL